jgi:hypothetical protein
VKPSQADRFSFCLLARSVVTICSLRTSPLLSLTCSTDPSGLISARADASRVASSLYKLEQDLRVLSTQNAHQPGGCCSSSHVCFSLGPSRHLRKLVCEFRKPEQVGPWRMSQVKPWDGPAQELRIVLALFRTDKTSFCLV